VDRTIRTLALPTAVIALGLGVAACGGGSSSGSTTTGASASPAPGTKVDSSLPKDVVAQVGDAQITGQELDRTMAQAQAQFESQGQSFPAAGTAQYQDYRQRILQQLIGQRIIGFEAAKCGKECAVSDSDVTKALDRIRAQSFNGSEKALQQYLTKQKLSADDARRLIRIQLQTPKLFAHVTRGVRYTDAQARAYYQSNQGQYRTAATRTARHILVKSHALAERIRKEVNDSNFATLAKRYSTDVGSKNQGGDLGPIQRGQLVPEFEKVAFSLKNKQISEPVKTQFGWHIIQVTVKPAHQQGFAEVQKQIVRTQLNQRRQAVYTAWQTKVLADYKKRTKYASADLAPPATTATTPTPPPTTAAAPPASTSPATPSTP
jgi:foldase protein PrsA